MAASLEIVPLTMVDLGAVGLTLPFKSAILFDVLLFRVASTEPKV